MEFLSEDGLEAVVEAAKEEQMESYSEEGVADCCQDRVWKSLVYKKKILNLQRDGYFK